MLVDPSPACEPVGKCIYCGATKGRLDKEHVIPKMLAGNMTLPRASCLACAEITKRLEGYMGRNVFRDLRVQHGFPMTEKPTHLPAYRTIPGGGAEPGESEKVLVPTADHPGFITMFVPGPPGIVAGRARGSEFPGVTIFQPVTPDGDDRAKKLGDHGARFLYRSLSVDHVGRFYAKVGLGMIVAACGVNGFENELGPVVLRKDLDWPHWVGGTTPEMIEIEPPKHAKPILHRAVVYGLDIGEWRYAAAQVQLLAMYGMPTFTVIGGRLRQSGAERLDRDR